MLVVCLVLLVACPKKLKWGTKEERVQLLTKMTHVCFTDYEKATGETVCIFLPHENTQTLYNLMANYKSSPTDAFQFVFTDKSVEKMPYVTDSDLQNDRSMQIRRVFVDGTLQLPEELLTSTNITNSMITLLGNGGIGKYIK
jgi:UDP-N-acetylmuramate-alanine ligase